ncbi:MAG: amidohydrolase [Chloroflexota bacterium]|nr:MAG: amidohydrolase [Chloroflexota bacterium]
MVATERAPAEVARRRTRTAVIDCDIHTAPRDEKTLGRYMSEQWRRHHESFGGRGHTGAYYPRANMNAARSDSWPPTGGPPGSDLGFLRAQLLDDWQMDWGILTPLIGAGGQLNPGYGEAMSRACNDWQIAEWCEPEPRLVASVVPYYEDGARAAAEIERCAADKRFVQVLVVARTAEPLGRRKYWPMYEAACKNDLPIAFHFGGSGGGPITGAGWPSYYYEDHCGMPPSFESQVTSFIFESVFDRFPTMRLVLIEGGFAWLPALGWRLDRAYQRFGSDAPRLKKLPSEYIRENVWLTTQPMEEPENPAHFHDIVAGIGADRLMFATDYPHWDFDAPDQALPVRLPLDVEAKIMAETARSFYRLGDRH